MKKMKKKITKKIQKIKDKIKAVNNNKMETLVKIITKNKKCSDVHLTGAARLIRTPPVSVTIKEKSTDNIIQIITKKQINKKPMKKEEDLNFK